jgi:hypothetical protein
LVEIKYKLDILKAKFMERGNIEEKLRMEDNMKVYFYEISYEFVYWIEVAQNRVQWSVLRLTFRLHY